MRRPMNRHRDAAFIAYWTLTNTNEHRIPYQRNQRSILHFSRRYEATMVQVSLREAITEDVPALVAVIHAGFEEYRGRLDPPSGAHGDAGEVDCED